MTPLRALAIAGALCAVAAWDTAAQATAAFGAGTSWPASDALRERSGERVTFSSHSPFTLRDIGADDAVATPVEGRLFLPAAAGPARPAPAVVLLHGSAGVLESREMTYARQFADLGIAALVVDTFASRRDRATRFIDRLLNITETMMVADAYAGLRALAARPDIDAGRIAVMGFSCGGMAATFAAYAQIADRIAPGGPRFAAHVAFYGPCIARFEDATTTGAPVLMLSGSADAIVDPVRCEEIAQDLRAGGSAVDRIVYDGAFHQWDGGFAGPRTIGRNLAPCRLHVSTGGWVLDARTGLPMLDPFTRKIILGLCADPEGYLIGRDDDVRARSDADVARFLARAFAAP